MLKNDWICFTHSGVFTEDDALLTVVKEMCKAFCHCLCRKYSAEGAMLDLVLNSPVTALIILVYSQFTTILYPVIVST